jgi:two-component system, response regulator PdtaR
MMTLQPTTTMVPALWLAAAASSSDQTGSDDNALPLAPGRALKVLVVEDEFFIALDVESQVQALGHTVVGIAVSADQAVATAERERPNLVLMDIQLAGTRDGIAGAVEIRERLGTQSIFVTANTDPHTLARAQSINPAGIIEKPLTIAKLRSQLERLKPS